MTQNVVITGCNRGIGLELARLYVKAGANVFGIVRTLTPELEELQVKIFSGIDLTQENSVKEVAAQIENVDILLHNAGAFENENLPLKEKDWQQIERQFQVNTLAPLKVAQAFLPQVKEGGLLAFVSSKMGSIADNTSGGYYGYRMSKAALNMAVKSLACDLEARAITVLSLHPGYVKTRMTGYQGEIEASEAAAGLFKTLTKRELPRSGTFWHSNGEELPW